MPLQERTIAQKDLRLLRLCQAGGYTRMLLMSLPDEFLRIDTPENVVFGYEVAGIGSRFMAALVDTLLILVLQLFVYMPLSLLVRSMTDGSAGWLVALFSLIAFVFLWGYYVFFEMLWNGQSPGKRWVGLRVIRTDGTPISLAESLIRNLVRLVDFMPAYYGVGVVAMFINEQSRRLGDLAADTLVVRDQAAVTLESLSARKITIGGRIPPPSDLHWPVKHLTNQDIQMAEDFMRRRTKLSGRTLIARQVALALLQRMGLPEDRLDEVGAEDLILVALHARRTWEEAHDNV